MLYVQHIEANLIHKPLNTDSTQFQRFACSGAQIQVNSNDTHKTINSIINSNNETNCIKNYWRFENKNKIKFNIKQLVSFSFNSCGG